MDLLHFPCHVSSPDLALQSLTDQRLQAHDHMALQESLHPRLLVHVVYVSYKCRNPYPQFFCLQNRLMVPYPKCLANSFREN